MSLVTRLVSPDKNAGEVKLPVHQFTMAIAEYMRGALLGADLVTKFNLDAGEVVTLQQWQTVLDASPDPAAGWRSQLEDIFGLGETKHYSMIEVESRLTDLGLDY